METKASILFSYIRGAVRGAYGNENLHGKTILIVGMDKKGQELLKRFCGVDTKLYFLDDSIKNYYIANTICRGVEPYTGTPVDIAIDLNKMTLIVNGEGRDLDSIGDEPYSQGIKDFYFV